MNESAVQTLATLVDYQSGSVVSRQVLKKQTGNITLFAFSEGEGLSEHTAPFDAWIYVLEGNATIAVGDASHEAGKGECLTLPANIPHAIQATTNFKMLLVMIKE